MIGERHRVRVERPHAVVALRREHDATVAHRDALTTGEAFRVRDLVARRRRHAGRIGNGCPRERADGLGEDFERARREIAPHGRNEAVERAVGSVLGEVQALARGVRSDGLVRERSHRRTRDRRRRADRRTLPDPSGRELFATQPGAPRRRAACAVDERSREAVPRTDDRAVAREPHVARAAGNALTVAHVRPPTGREREARTAVRRERARHSRCRRLRRRSWR